MSVSLVIVGSRTVFPSIGEIDLEVDKLPLPWDADGPGPEAYRRVIHEVVDGGADGGDYAGRLWAEARGIPVHDEPITAEDVLRWNKYLAPKVRNGRMADRGAFGVAFWDGKSKGTCDFVTRMVYRRKPVLVVACKVMPGRPRRPRLPGCYLNTGARRPNQVA